MISPEEHVKIADIKRRVTTATPEEKQWILNLVARERTPIRKVVMVRAKNEGFNVEGIITL